MLAPVVSSSLTTIAAFSPLLIVGGVIGSILQDIPIIVICVILASLIECFFILPEHLQQSLNRGQRHDERQNQTSTRPWIHKFPRKSI